MPFNRQSRVKEVFEAASSQPAEKRERYLDEACSGNDELRHEVESLLLESGRLTIAGEDTDLLDDSFRAEDAQVSEGGAEGLPRSIGRYRIVSLLGEGGMGRVYEAEDPELKRRVALKVLTPKLATDAKFLSRFKREAQTVAALSHPNVVTLYSVEESEDTHFLTMELVRGEPLHHLIPEGGFDLKELLDKAIPLVEGLRAAHEAGIVHRDLKPGNVMVDLDGRVRILDFGLAKQHTADPTDSQEETMTALTAQGAIVGTVPYMSPEQVAGQEVDQRSDLFSLGVILHEMCLGTRPFRGETATHTMSAILRDRPELVSRIRGDLPEHLGRIVRRCLEKEPSKRYQTARVVKEELEHLRQEVESGQTLSPVPPRPQKSGAVKWLVPAGAVVLLSAIGYLMFSQGSITSTLEETGAPSRASAETPVKLIAVLPLRNLGPAEDEYFAVGITEEIISRLAMIPGLGLISSSSTSSFKGDSDARAKEIGEKLGVDYVISGGIRWARQADGTSRVRITPRLIRVEDNLHLWSEVYDRTMDDIFEVQSDIASRVAEQLGAALVSTARTDSQNRPTESQEAYQAYLRGRFATASVQCEGIRSRLPYLERAVELDPSFTEAWAALAQGHAAAFAHCLGHPEEHKIGGRRALQRASELAPESRAVMFARGQYLMQVEGQYEAALVPLDKASLLGESSHLIYAKASIYRRQGRWDEALAGFKRAVQLDPNNLEPFTRIVASNMWMRNYAEAVEGYNRAIELAPEVNAFYLRKAWVHWLWKGDTEAARATLEVLPKTEPSMAIQWGWFWQRIYEEEYQTAIEGLDVLPDRPLLEIDLYLAPKPLLKAQAFELLNQRERAQSAYEEARAILEGEVEESPTDAKSRGALALAYAGLDRKEEALNEIQKAMELVPFAQQPYFGLTPLINAALVHTKLGEYDQAIDYLDTLLAIPSSISVPWLQLDPRWKPLWGHPRFKDLKEKYGIVAHGR